MSRKELYAGVLMILFGLGTALGSLQYSIGEPQRMGPGFFPLLLGVILALLGLWIALMPAAASDDDGEGAADEPGLRQFRRHLRPWAAILAGVVLFILAGNRGGLVPATFLLIFVSALADRNNSLKVCLLLALATTVVTVAVFHFGLSLQFPLFAWE